MKQPYFWQNFGAVGILLLGLTRMVGYSLDNRVLQGIGAASGIAPFTKVFSDTEGYEAFTASFLLRGMKADGRTEEIHLTPATYAKLEGPYQRRNVYGAALVFAPRLPEPLRLSLHQQALRPGAPLRKELGIGQDWVTAELLVTPRPGSSSGPWTYPINCQ